MNRGAGFSRLVNLDSRRADSIIGMTCRAADRPLADLETAKQRDERGEQNIAKPSPSRAIQKCSHGGYLHAETWSNSSSMPEKATPAILELTNSNSGLKALQFLGLFNSETNV